MAIQLNDSNAKLGFTFASLSDLTSIQEKKDRMIIVDDGRLLLNKTRLGLTAAEAEYLTDAVNKQLLTNASIRLDVNQNPYEVKNSTDLKSSITFTLTLKVNNSISAIVNSTGSTLNAINLTLTTSTNNTVIVPLAKQSDNTYSKTITMNSGSNTDNNKGNIADFVKGNCYISDDIYCKIIKDKNTYILALTKPNISVSQGGLVYYGVTNGNNFYNDTEDTIIGASEFADYVSSSSKGYLTLDLGTCVNTNNGYFAVGTNNDGTAIAPAKLTCLNLLNTVSNQTITMNPTNDNGYYGIIVLPNNINLGKFATSNKDSTVINGNVYNATNTANNSDSPFILLTSTTFKKCNGLIISSKNITYNIYRTKNKLMSAITIKL